MIHLKAINLKTNEERVLTLNDLYRYEEEEGALYRSSQIH